MAAHGYAAKFVAKQERKSGRSQSPDRLPRRQRSSSVSPPGVRPRSRTASPRSVPEALGPSNTAPKFCRVSLLKAVEELSMSGWGISEKDRAATRTWLRALQLEVLPDEEAQPLLTNPLRNGVLLCEVVGLLEGPMKNVSRCPRDVLSCRRNIHGAFQTLGMIPPGVDAASADHAGERQSSPGRRQSKQDDHLHSSMVWNVERILQGNNSTVWALLNFLRQKHPRAQLACQSELVVVDGNVMRSSLGTGECMVRSAEGDLRSPRSSPPRQAWREVQLPYDHACTCALEQTLMRWLAELGLVEASHVAQGLDSVMGRLADGTLLCELAAIMEGQPLRGTHSQAHTPALRHANIHRALDHLWAQRDMSRRYLRNPDALLRGERGACVGLLEDIHRLMDRMPRRPDVPKEGEQPYLKGTYVGIYGPLANHPAIPKPLTAQRGGISPTRPPWCSPSSRGEGPQAPAAPIDDASRRRSPAPRRRRAAPESTRSRSPSPVKQYRIVNKGAASPPPELPEPRAEERRAGSPARPAARAPHRPPPSPSRRSGGALSAPQPRAGADHAAWRHSPAVRMWAAPSEQTYPEAADAGAGDAVTEASDIRMSELVTALDRASPSRRAAVEANTQEGIASWVEALGVTVHPRWSLEAACKDGLLLCELVGKLQHKALPGVTAKPTSRASCLHNVRKALEVLRNKPNMAVTHLWSERAIVEGKPCVAAALLADMRRAYRQVWTSLTSLKKKAKGRRPSVGAAVPPRAAAGVAPGAS
eukprot:jgi/Tetstr1/430493/TSEL_020301.t1